MIMPDMARMEFMAYMKRMIGLPYRFGGDDPMTGFDCSGLVVEGLKAVGMIEPKSDYTAASLWNFFTTTKQRETASPRNGVLVFFADSTGQIVHVAICKSPWLMIEAGGGDHTTTTEEQAIKQNAFIRIRPIANRTNVKGYVDPFLSQ